MAAPWVGQFCHRVSMLAVAVEGVMNAKEHPTHIILHDFGVSLGDLASSLKELQKELEVSCSLTFCTVLMRADIAQLLIMLLDPGSRSWKLH